MTPSIEAKKKKEKKSINIALQGGGSHGAFTWGVLDRILEDGRIEIEGFSGTSAGGMNAIAAIQGLMKGGHEQARAELKKFWHSISKIGEHSPINYRGAIDKMLGEFTMYHSPAFLFFSMLIRLFSPYDLNPLCIDPLRDVITKSFDFKSLQKYKNNKAFLCATHVFTGKLRIFNLNEITPEVLLATACLPTIHQAVNVDGEYYWDGGFIGNPALFPLIYNCECPDILLIQLNPSTRNNLPRSAREILDRLNEITNNASVVREMRAIHFISDLIDQGVINEKKVKRVYMHLINDEETFADLGGSSALNTEWEFLTHLFERGRAAADKWIKENYEKIGKETTASLKDHYVGDLHSGHTTSKTK